MVVSFNYREGIEGYARIEGAPANRGLLDQIAALHWVQDNITAFGGDPHQVTAFGQSAGAGAVATLLATPRAAGLFSRGIIESLPGTFFSDELAADIAATMAAEVGRRPTAADLSVVDPHQLPAAGADLTARISQYSDRWGPLAQANRIFAPVVNGEVLPTTPWQALAGGAAREVELIAGHNREEYRFFMVLDGQVEKISDEQATRALRALAPGPDGEHAYRQAYPGNSAEQLFQLVQSDWQYRMPTQHLADAQAAGGGRVHLYELTWPAPGSGGAYRACHTLEVTLLFGNPQPHVPRPRAAARRPGAGGPLPDRLDRLRHHRRPRLACLRPPPAPDPGLRHRPGSHRLPRRHLPAAVAPPPLPGATAAYLLTGWRRS